MSEWYAEHVPTGVMLRSEDGDVALMLGSPEQQLANANRILLGTKRVSPEVWLQEQYVLVSVAWVRAIKEKDKAEAELFMAVQLLESTLRYLEIDVPEEKAE